MTYHFKGGITLKNYQIHSVDIANIVELTAGLFRTMNKEIPYRPNRNDKANQMHFVVDLLKELVDTAYPVEKCEDEEIQGQEIHFIRVDEMTPFKHKDLMVFLKNFGSEGEK